MPHKPPRICPRCKGKITGPHCPKCRQPWQGSTNRGSNTAKAQRLRRQVLADEPICTAPGCTHLATEVDHIVPLAEGGDRYDRTNLTGLCRDHHRLKTAQEATRGRKRRPQG